MKRSMFIVLLLFCASALRAQDIPAVPIDGSVPVSDSLKTPPVQGSVLKESLRILYPPVSLFLPLPEGFETGEQRASRLNGYARLSVMNSVRHELSGYRKPYIPKEWKPVYMLGSFAANMFLGNPFGFPEGCVPLMNHSFPFIYAKVPGLEPYEYRYSPDKFPQNVRTEFDFASGTYRQVTVDWQEWEKNMSKSFGNSYNNEPIPFTPVTPVEKYIYR